MEIINVRLCDGASIQKFCRAKITDPKYFSRPNRSHRRTIENLLSMNQDGLSSKKNDIQLSDPEDRNRTKRKYRSTICGFDDDKLRSACDACTQSKIRCTGGRPCERCRKRGQECIFSEKRRCGPKKREDIDNSDDRSSSSPRQYGSNDRMKSLLSEIVLHHPETKYMDDYLSTLNSFCPIADKQTICDALQPLPFHSNELEMHRKHARRSSLWSCIALGALLSSDMIKANIFIQNARQELKECFDSSVEELSSAYILMTLYHLHILDISKISRYAGYVKQCLREQSYISPQYAACVRFIQVSLYLIGIGESPEIVPPAPISQKSMTCTNARSFMLDAISFVLVNLFSSSKKSVEVNSTLLREMLSLLQKVIGLEKVLRVQDHISAVCAYTLQGCIYQALQYFDDAKNCHFNAIRRIQDNLQVLNTPVVWMMASCTQRALSLLGEGRSVEPLEAVMKNQQNQLKFAECCTRVGLLLASVETNSSLDASRQFGGIPYQQQQQHLNDINFSAPCEHLFSSFSTHPSTVLSIYPDCMGPFPHISSATIEAALSASSVTSMITSEHDQSPNILKAAVDEETLFNIVRSLDATPDDTPIATSIAGSNQFPSNYPGLNELSPENCLSNFFQRSINPNFLLDNGNS